MFVDNRNEVPCGSSPFVNVCSSPPDLHLEPGSCAVNAASRFVSWDPIDGRSREWRECLPGKTMTDLGAYGGPFAVIDNNGDGIPDCDLPSGYATAVAMLMDSVGQPVPLQYRNPALADPGFDDDPLGDPPAPDAGLTFAIVSPPAHGTLSGSRRRTSRMLDVRRKHVCCQLPLGDSISHVRRAVPGPEYSSPSDKFEQLGKVREELLHTQHLPTGEVS